VIVMRAADGSAAGDQHRLAEQVAGTVGRVQRHRQRLGHGDLAERNLVVRDLHTLRFGHREVLAEHALHMWEHARAAEEANVVAEILAALAAGRAFAAGARRIDRDAIARGHARDAGTDCGHDARGLVAGCERFADHEVADPAMQVVVQIGAADAGSPQLDQHLAGSRFRHGRFDDAQIVGAVNLAFEHCEPLLRGLRIARRC
jgi:hypothetical protein